MDLTYFLAQVFGLTLITASFTFFLEKKMMMEVVAGLVSNRALLYVLGILDLIFGLAIVLTHNYWVEGDMLTNTVTLLGWLLLVKGVVRMTIPTATIKKFYKSKLFSSLMPLAGWIALVLGGYLTYQGFTVGY